MPLLSNVIFLSESGSDGRGFGDISLNQGTDSQSIATASEVAIDADQGVGFATAGSIGNILIEGTSEVTLMGPGTVGDMATMGGLFFMAGDNNGPADGGSAGKNTEVEIDSLTIELNLSAPGTFGANNIVGGLFTVSSGVSAMGGKYVSGIDTEPLAHHVSTTGAIGTIGLITLDDMAVTNTSGLIEAPFGTLRSPAPRPSTNAAVIIADVGGEVRLLKDRVLDHDAQSHFRFSRHPPSSIGGAGDRGRDHLFRECSGHLDSVKNQKIQTFTGGPLRGTKRVFFLQELRLLSCGRS